MTGARRHATIRPFDLRAARRAHGPYAVAEGTEGAIWLRGRVLDGNGDIVPDAMI